ncbi:hypothetical protein BDR07DRAFT_1476322 [Suillus spraguei]|nr:hypothetical protein BDR07DRAFT_1476322 [Suillus spraguei]
MADQNPSWSNEGSHALLNWSPPPHWPMQASGSHEYFPDEPEANDFQPDHGTTLPEYHGDLVDNSNYENSSSHHTNNQFQPPPQADIILDRLDIKINDGFRYGFRHANWEHDHAGHVTNWGGITSNSEKTQTVCWEVLQCPEEDKVKVQGMRSEYYQGFSLKDKS